MIVVGVVFLVLLLALIVVGIRKYRAQRPPQIDTASFRLNMAIREAKTFLN